MTKLGLLVTLEAILQIDPGERGREQAKVSRRRADEGRELAETPMRHGDWIV
jgi:hypothetical protein